MRIRTILAAAAAPAAIAAALLGTAGQASAATTPHLTGAVELTGGVPQYAAFGNIGAPTTGTFSYVNFNAQDIVQTGVWTPLLGRAVTIDFNNGTQYEHTLTVDSITPTASNAYTFTGHGSWNGANGDPGFNWTATGSVAGNQISLHIAYANGYTVDVTGATIHNGSGTDAGAIDGGIVTDSLGQALTFSAPAGSMVPALAYQAGITGVSNVTGTDMTFSSKVATGHAYAGTPFSITVHDGGNPGVNDTYAQDGTQYQVIGGNLTVH